MNIHQKAALTTEIISLSHSRENLLHVRYAVCRHMEIVWPNFAFAFGVWVSFLNLQENPSVPGFLLWLRVSSYFHPELHLSATLENSTMRLDWNLLLQVSVYLSNHFDRVPWVSPGCLTQSDSAQSPNLSRHAKPSSSSSALTLPRSCSLLPVLTSISPSLVKLKCWQQQIKLKWLMFKKNEEDCSTHRVWSSLLRRSASWCLVSTHLIWILGIQINSVKQPIKSNSVGSGYMSHCWTSAFDDSFNHCFVALKNVEHRTELRRLRVRRNIINITHCKIVVMTWNLGLFWVCLFDVVLRDESPRTWSFVFFDWFGEEWNTSITKSQRSRAGIPSMRKPAWREIFSASVKLCETGVCFLHIQLIGTNVWHLNMKKVPPEVDFESSRSPAKSESWNSPNLHCLAILPTWRYCLYSHVWWIYQIYRFMRLSQAFVHFVIDRESLFTDHRISALPIRAKY